MQNYAAISFLLTNALLVACTSTHSDAKLVTEEFNSTKSLKLSIVKYNYGATVPYVYRFFVLEPNKISTKENPEMDVFRTDNIDGTQFSWSGDSGLTIQCAKGRIYKFNNFGYVNAREIKIELSTRC